MKVLICGGRDFTDSGLMGSVLRPIMSAVGDPAEVTFILGAAPGADTLAERWAEVFGARKRVFPADWAAHGKAAGPIRNQQMLDVGRPDIVVAFPGGRGTADMVRRAKAAGVKVVEITR